MQDITRALSIVSGGRGRAIAAGVKAAYNTARPWIGKTAEALDTVGKAAGGAWAAKEAWDHFRGNGQPQK